MCRYKQLKKMLKRCRSNDATIDPQQEEAFFIELQSELAMINTYFQTEADRTVAAYRRSTRTFNLWLCTIPLQCFARGPKKYAALADRAYWCRKYARANAVALRKILKKHDKTVGSSRGREFLQQCWCSASADGIGLFLHSPLLDELKAIQDVLQQKITELQEDDHLHHHGDDDIDGDVGGHNMNATGTPSKTPTLPRTPTTAKQQEEEIEEEERQEEEEGSSAQDPHLPHHPTTPITTHTNNNTNEPLEGTSPMSPLTRHSPSAVSIITHSSDGLVGAVTVAAAAHLTQSSLSGSIDGASNATAPSLRAQRSAALAAIQESPTHMLDSSDIEWGEDDSPHVRAAYAFAFRNTTTTTNPGGRYSSRLGGESEDTSMLSETDEGTGVKEGPAAGGVGQDKNNENNEEEEEEVVMAGIDPDAPVPPSPNRMSPPRSGDVNNANNTTTTTATASPQQEQQQQQQQPRSHGGSSTVGMVLGPFRNEELRCPICLDLMYKPVGLGCGHKFCRQCALDAAGFGRACGAFRNIVSYIPARTPCPHCRQTNVYKNAVSLKEVGTLIRSRYPEQWAERKGEERQRMRDLSEHNSRVRREQIMTLMGTTPYDLINIPL